jgi:Rrf2 family protein
LAFWPNGEELGELPLSDNQCYDTVPVTEIIMPTSSRFAVAVHALVALAANEGRALPSETIAGSANTNAAVIRRLFSMLAEAGITTSQLGHGGGALLALRPERITLLDVFRAVEDRDIFAVHRASPDRNCIVGKNILPVLMPRMDNAQQALEAELGSVTIADLAMDIQKRTGVRFPLQHSTK